MSQTTVHVFVSIIDDSRLQILHTTTPKAQLFYLVQLFLVGFFCGGGGVCFSAFDFCLFSIPDFIQGIYVLILTLEKEPVFSLLNVQC